MRLLVITELFLPTKGGTAVWFDEVYRRLGGKEIHIVTAAVSGAEKYDIDHSNSIHRLTLKRYGWLRPESLAIYLKFLMASIKWAIRGNADAVHAGRVLPEGLVGWLTAKIGRKPLVIYAHGEEITTWRQAAKFKIMCFAYRHADRVIANSGFTQDKLVELGVRPDRIALISPGVDIDRFHPGLECDDLRAKIGLSSTHALILSVGRLSRRKGFDQIVRSLPILLARNLDVHYAIIGIGEDRDHLQNLIKGNSVQDRVHLLGHVEAADLPRWYNACSLFAMPNREIDGDTEGFGMVFLEAAACGKAALAGQAGGTGAAVIHDETGLRVNGEDLSAVATALERLLKNREESERMGAAGRRRAVANYSWQAVARKTMSLHEAMIRKTV